MFRLKKLYIFMAILAVHAWLTVHFYNAGGDWKSVIMMPNGQSLPLTLLNSMAQFMTVFIPIYVADLITGEVKTGTLKLSLLRPVRRIEWLNAKLVSLFVFMTVLLVFSITAEYAIGTLAFGWGEQTLYAGTLHTQTEGVWLTLYLTFSMLLPYMACGMIVMFIAVSLLYREYRPQLMILDIMLPKLDGMEVCRTIRSESSIPIIMLSAKKSDVDKIVGLGIGADDYVVKPFSPAEIIARVKAQLRRANQLSSPAETSEIVRYQDLELNIKAYEVTVRSQPVPFSAKEFEVLRFFAFHPNQVLTREQIFQHVWGLGERGDLNTVTVHIKKIREKIEIDPANPTMIKTVWGVGYKLDGGPR
ncbi:response regulator [Paenibacillus hemerocallicola]|uniref:Response regulator n=2 Tax=Paenibacillus hemerocallicola TaxID=1172614 RepID=A0A5C4T2W4_9BACL|nr:response regulator [Paenibacillus hemerocallicola]